MLGPATGPSQPLIALYSDALPGAKRRSRGAGSCMGAKPPGLAESGLAGFEQTAREADRKNLSAARFLELA